MTTEFGKKKTRFEKFLEKLVEPFTNLTAIVLGLLILALLIMWLWNFICPQLFGLPEVSYWQAFALGLLSRLILGFK
jgi:ABC-type phosphate transport system permease subunit